MQLQFESSRQIASGNQGVLTHLPDNTLALFVRNGSQLYYIQGSVPFSDWGNVSLQSPELACNDTGIDLLSHEYLSGAFTWLTWTVPGEKRRIAVFPKVDEAAIDFMNGLLTALSIQNKTGKSGSPGGKGVTYYENIDYMNGFAVGLVVGKK